MAAKRSSGDLVRLWRQCQQPRMSQAELGARLGISGTYIRKFERGQLGMGLELKAQLSRLTGIPLRRLLTKNEEALLASAIELLDDAA